MRAQAERLRALRDRLQREEVQALLVSSAANVRYLTGFTGEGLAVITAEGGLVSTDGRYLVEASAISDGLQSVTHELGHLVGACEYLREQGAAAVAFESEALTYSSYETLGARLEGVAFTPCKRWVEDLRVVKSPEEVACMREAARRVDVALAAFEAQLGPGPTERELALELERQLVLAGTTPSFEIIMAAGESAASPHAVPGERRLALGDMLKIDVGGKVEGYCSDITRTYFCGEPDKQFRKVYGLVLAAQEQALAVVRAGVSGREVDAAAREVIVAGGYGEAFTHGLGHGVGLQVHEAPRVSAKSEDVLTAGMVVTIEPGIYVAGWGGVRIEDMVLVTETGGEVLTGAAKGRWGCGGGG